MTVKEIFETMDYGPAPESESEARAWLEKYDHCFGHFIAGAFNEPSALFETRNPARDEVLAGVSQGSASDVAMAVSAARAAQPGWAALGGHGRARKMYALARLVQKHARLFAVLESLDSGKPIREARDIDVPLVARHFYYHAGMAQLMAEELPGRVALGVCGQIIPWNFPLLMLAWKVAPALAMGNTVVLKPAEWTPLTALLFAEISREAGLPPGVFNVVTGDGRTGAALVDADVDKIAFTGSTEVGRRIRQATAGRGVGLTLELGGKSPFIVFDDADLDSAVEGVVDAIWFNGGQVCCAGSRLLVQEGIAESFYAKLIARMDTLRVGDPLDKCIDIGSLVHPDHLARVLGLVETDTGTRHRSGCSLPATGAFMAPTLVTDLHAADALMQEEVFGPVLAATTFRTPAEAVALANDTRYGLAASIWSENVNLALGIAPKLAAGVVWINGTNMFDAAAGFGGVRESGFGREGGWEGLAAYTKPSDPGPALPIVAPTPAPDTPHAPDLDRTAKMYIGGKQARPDSGYSRSVWSTDGRLLGHVGDGNRKDIRNAVEAARKAQAGWAGAGRPLRSQVLYFLAENLHARAAEFANRIEDLTGQAGADEVAATIERLFTWAAWADKDDGAVKPVPLRGLAVAVQEPVGVIGILAPDGPSLLGLVSVLAPALAFGNAVVVAPSEASPLIATDLFQVLDTSDVPSGAVNIVTGASKNLAKTLADHADVDAVWSFAGQDLSTQIETAAAGNLKRTWVPRRLDFEKANGDAFRAAAQEIKTIWVPYGE